MRLWLPSSKLTLASLARENHEVLIRQNAQASSLDGCASPVIFSILLIWITVVAFSRQIAVIFVSAVPDPTSNQTAVLASIVELILLGLPLLPVARFWQNPRYRVYFQTWALATLYILFLIPVHFVNPTATQSQAILQIFLSLVYSLLVTSLARRRNKQQGDILTEMHSTGAGRWPTVGMIIAILIAAIPTYPWVAWGAFGSPLDTLLQLLAALAFGFASGILVHRFLTQPMLLYQPFTWQTFILGGLGIGITLLVMSSGLGFSFGSMQVLLMLVLPSLGWSLVGLALPTANKWEGRGFLPMAVLVGLVSAAPMTLIDPDELALVIAASPGEILQWAFAAASISALIGFIVSFLIFLLILLRGHFWNQNLNTSSGLRWIVPALAALAIAAWIAAGGIYFSVGQPGFYGEHMFVIFRDQADLSSARNINDYVERRRFVYTTLVDKANTSQAEIRQTLNRFNIPYTPYYLENAIGMVGNPLLQIWLAGRPEVDRILESPRMRPLPENPPVSTGNASAPSTTPWNISLIRAERVWEDLGITGQGIVIGQSDSGVQGNHPELAANYRGKDGDNNYNWYDPWNGTNSPTDIGGHGTHTLGSIVGQHTGVAPGATWFGCVNLARNLGNPAYYLDCMQFMLAPFPLDGLPLVDGDPSRGAHVINNSWGCPELEGCDPTALQHAVHALRDAGVFVVASAGNDGPACETISDPLALYPDVYSIGAIDRFGQLADFSSRGPVTADGSNRVKPEILAPGVNILSAFPGSTYNSLSGTSMAGPHAVGVVALIWSANPALVGNIDRTEQILNQTAQRYTGAVPACPGANSTPSTAVGFGIIDAYAAVQIAIQEGK